MARNATRRCIEWAPGDAALEALHIAESLFPDLPRQETIDRLVLTGLHALRHPPYAPPPLFGRDRDRWKLPAVARVEGAEPGKRSSLDGQ